MGGSHSREDDDLDSESEYDEQDEVEDQQEVEDDERERSSGSKSITTPPSIDDLDSKLRSLELKYSNPVPPSPSPCRSAGPNSARLYLHIGGAAPSSRWITSEKLADYSFSRPASSDDEGEVSDRSPPASSPWILKVGTKIRADVGPKLLLKPFPEQRRVDFVAGDGVWALKFFTQQSFQRFVDEHNKCLFENTYRLEANDENKVRVFGRDFAAWADPGAGDDSIWEDAGEDFRKSPIPFRAGHDLLEEFEQEADGEGGGIQSLALGALDNSFLVSDSGVQVLKNYSHGVHGKGVSVRFSNSNGGVRYSTPKKALLTRAETNMLLMSPAIAGKPHANGIHQLDIETGKVVTEWRFEKDGADIAMRDITNDSKGAQLDPSASTFLGLDDNRLCRWDMRDRRGMVQNIADSAEMPVLHWAQGHQFSRGTNFQCFATAGDGSIVVGSVDGKIRLYSKSSMRMAKTAFPGLGSPITHVDVTYDGKWILGTTDTYLVLISTVFKDKDGKEKTGFCGRMGNKIAAPRLLKLNPLDAHMAGANSSFHGGQFSWVTEEGKQERHLVATMGKFSVIWNFQQVRSSGHECYRDQQGLKSCYCYKVVLKDQSIVDSGFMHDKFAASAAGGDGSPEAPLVVATQMKVSSFSISSKTLF